MLDEPWPPFLNLLDDNPERAFGAFYSYARSVLKAKPPRPMFDLNDAESEDITQEIILHCVRDDFRVLRRYTDRGRPFAAWLYVLAHNKCLDYLRRRKRDADVMAGHTNDFESNPDRFGADPSISPEQESRLRAVLRAVNGCMSRLSRYCRLLLELAADEYMPSEMALVLGWPKDMNKKISDDLRECRRRLKKMLANAGVDVTSALPP